ncbi:hypothetical protein PAXRUDRAFT_20088 [Paxillus rubicundulus Ve08.2h10]|uniref:Uncharacterized protein n=1 Tax=Paxillus rubicundulus Ve08.2h10 TaxID=930991 RepID=A0A0D0CFP9_9AGAM|nr:hypothetical protein PAXRUDRAFT_20088 [Paxillus rubicundulus Ve08.2h10]
MGAEEEMKIEEDDEEDVAYRRRQKEHAKGKKRADATEGESLLGKRKADEALEDARERRRPRMHGSSRKMTTTQPMLGHLPSGRMTTAKKATRPKRMTAMPTPAPPSTPPRMPIPVPNPTQRRQGRQGCRRGAPQPLAAPQPVNACSTCVDFGILCEPNPGYSCFTCRSRKKNPDQQMRSRNKEHPPDLEHHLRLQPQDHDVLCVPLHLSRGHPSTPSHPQIPKIIPTWHPAVQGSYCASRLREPLEHSTMASHQELGPAEPSHSPSPSLSSNTIAIPSAVNLGMRWHIGPAIIRSTTPIPPSVSPWTSSDTRRSRSMPATGTIYSGPQMSSADDPPIPAPVSPAISILPVEVLAETESSSDNVGSGSSE